MRALLFYWVINEVFAFLINPKCLGIGSRTYPYLPCSLKIFILNVKVLTSAAAREVNRLGVNEVLK